MKRSSLLLFFLCIALLGGGCFNSVPAEQTIQQEPQNPESPIHKETVEGGLTEIRFTYGSTTREQLLLYRIDPAIFSFDIEHASSARSIADWHLALNTPTLVVNAGYFHEDYSPSGLLIRDGVRIGGRSFDEKRSAVLQLAPHPAIIDTSGKAFDAASAKDAVQSYPLLISNGAPNISEDSGLVGRRTVFGFDRDGFSYVGVIADDQVTLFELAGILERTGVDWTNVINLDGGSSTGLATADETLENSIVPVPNVIVVRKK